MTEGSEKILAHVEQVAGVFHLSSLGSQIETCHALLNSAHNIEVAIFGRFKAGKSSFINSLIGRDILPVGVLPTTSVITKLRYGPTDQLVVHFLDKRTEAAAVSELAEFITEKNNPENRKHVALVEVLLPELKRYEGLVFVDTPGLGSIFTQNTATALAWLAKAGAALVAISVDPPLSEQDLALIENLQQFTPKICLLLTKADLLEDEQRQEVAEFIRTKVRERFGRELPLFFYSVKAQQAHFRATLTAGLFSSLLREQSKHAGEILAYKLHSLLNQGLHYLEIAQATAEKSAQERKALLRQIINEKNETDLVRTEVRLMRDKLLAETRPKIVERLRQLQADIHRRLAEQLQGHLKEWHFNLWKLTRTYEDWLYATLSDELSSLSAAEQGLYQAILSNANRAFCRIVSTWQARLAQNIEGVLGIHLQEPAWEIPLHAPTSPQVFVGQVFEHHLDLLWFLIPMGIFRPLIERHFHERLSRALEKSLSRYAAQWVDILNEAIKQMGARTLSSIEAELSTIEELLVRHRSDLSEVSTVLEETRKLQQQSPQHLQLSLPS